MITVEADRRDDGSVLGRTDTEYERPRAQSRVWEAATGRLLDQVALAPGASCLDAGCGPGETMRLLAERVGRSGHVLGVDVTATDVCGRLWPLLIGAWKRKPHDAESELLR